MKRALLFLFLAAAAASCKERPPDALTWEEEMVVDSIYRAEIPLLRPELDSICDQRFDSLVAHYKDSLWTRRLQEIERQLERLQIK